VVVTLHLNQESILIASWRNQIRIHLSWSPIVGSGGEETCPVPTFTSADWSGSI
jgi:hypothetical protein